MLRKLMSLSAIVALVAACSDATGVGGATRVSLSLSTAGSGPQLSVSAADTLTDGQNQLVFSSVEVVLREVELERVDVIDCDIEPEPDGCEKFETGPMLAQLPLTNSVATAITIDVAPGTYDAVEFDIHKVSNGDPEDAQFRATYPDLIDTSVRVRGWYNGAEFTYTTDLMDEQKYDLIPAVVVTEGMTTNVTLYLDVASWFADAAGDLIDPASANKGEANENMVKDNIRDSIDVFEDSDRDGRR